MTSQLQQQDLVVYNDGQIVSEKLLRGEYNSLTAITHIQGTAPSWLLTGVAENCLLGTCHFSPGLGTNLAFSANEPRSPVLFASFYQDAAFYSKTWKKHLGLDIASQTGNARYLDLMEELMHVLSRGADPKQSLKHVFDKISTEVQKLAAKGAKPSLIIEAPELLLHTIDIEVDDLLLSLHKLNEKTNLTLVMSIDRPLIEAHSIQDGNGLRGKHSSLVLKLLHRANTIIDIHPLETGHANDATGVLTVSKGPIPLDDVKVQEGAYLYLLNKEGSARLFFK
ncbi:unnamed protein product [Kuraishia capsulata CBS 1993]|uniref:Elongator complex protein 6 n=1 Tax=Kuraishia capsulata CBS 1993 TaxID=1382522 RepID=W6MTQ5_9ASCO|nr:uncharacterized protein KUCA_T00005852001 [Kuraishia capsulata CBS 1993]CDK29858.1 unnamed protein product [Kuraishia capsulata CBS 1993]